MNNFFIGFIYHESPRIKGAVKTRAKGGKISLQGFAQTAAEAVADRGPFIQTFRNNESKPRGLFRKLIDINHKIKIGCSKSPTVALKFSKIVIFGQAIFPRQHF